MQQGIVDEEWQICVEVFDAECCREIAKGMGTRIVYIEITNTTDWLLRSAAGTFDNYVALTEPAALKLPGFDVENCNIAQIQNAVVAEIGVADDNCFLEWGLLALPEAA